MTFWETIERGEYVMFALAVIFIIITVIWCVRVCRLGKYNKSYPDLMQRVRDHVTEGDVENARQLCEVVITPGARMICAGVSRIGTPIHEVKTSMAEVADIEKEKMTAGAYWLKILAIVAPLIGLGGTLTGMVDRLRDLGEGVNPVDTAMVCDALAPTIVTTVAGLGVGVFSLIALACLEATIRSSRIRLDEVAVEFINLLNEPS